MKPILKKFDSLIFSFDKSYIEPKLPIFLNDFKFVPLIELFFVIFDINFTKLSADAILTPLFLYV